MYTVDYFIEKFTAIPEDKWCEVNLECKGSHCALGHCGVVNYEPTVEANALVEIIKPVYLSFPNVLRCHSWSAPVADINDLGGTFGALGTTPKQRILAALQLAKAKQA